METLKPTPLELATPLWRPSLPEVSLAYIALELFLNLAEFAVISCNFLSFCLSNTCLRELSTCVLKIKYIISVYIKLSELRGIKLNKNATISMIVVYQIIMVNRICTCHINSRLVCVWTSHVSFAL